MVGHFRGVIQRAVEVDGDVAVGDSRVFALAWCLCAGIDDEEKASAVFATRDQGRSIDDVEARNAALKQVAQRAALVASEYAV